MQRARTLFVLLSVCMAVLVAGCGSPESWDEPLGVVQHEVKAPLAGAYCTANVIGKGNKSTEDDYLPRVIACENGGANLEALKAQAIAARSVLYYNMATSGSICDSQGCQVYSCGAAPAAKHYQAVKETAGMYLSYAGTLTYGFYVAGDSGVKAPSCKDSSGSTTKYITYNEGKTGTAVTQTSLGWIGPAGNGQNRGCMGQWGARCLENQKGYGYQQILRFYYGADIQILKATGPCTQGCAPTHCEGSKLVSACGKGDCAAYGAKCVDDSKGVRCVSVFCPALGSKKVCVNDDLLGTCSDGAITTGSCGAYGAKCVEDSLGARCVNVFCPAKGKSQVCLDDSKIMDCSDGAPGTVGECGAYGAYCSTAGVSSARCVSAFCVKDPKEIPKAHDVCLPDGQLAHCTDAGGLTNVKKCAAGTKCVASGGSAVCSDGSAGGSGGSASGGASGAAGSGWGGSTSEPIDPEPMGGTGSRPASGDVEGGCSAASARKAPAPFGVLLLAVGSLWFVRRRAAPRRRSGLGVVLLALPLSLLGCGAEIPQDEQAHESCEPPVATLTEELSSIDCSEKQATGYKSGAPFAISVVTVDGKPVEKDTANAYYVMAQAAAKAGVTLKIVSGFRTMAEQQYLYNCYTSCSCNGCNLAAKPGYSNHQSGHALDLNTSSPGVYSWLQANGAAFGFKRTVPSEAWHWEWWGGGPGGGPCSCKPTHCEGSKMVSSCGKGDCAAYGAKCVNDSQGVRCVSVFCPAQGSKKVCVNGDLLGTCSNGAITTGSCGAYGAKCVEDSLGARCVNVFCPAKGKTNVCLDDTKIMECTNGAPSPAGDCGAYGAYCSTAGVSSARCVSAFCVKDPKEIPKAHDVCLPDGQLAHCTDAGGLTGVKKCAAGTKCVASGGSATCSSGSGSGGSGGNGAAGGAAGNPGWAGSTSTPIDPEPVSPQGPGAHKGLDDAEGSCSFSTSASRRGGSSALLLFGLGLVATLRRRRVTCAGTPRRGL